MSGSFNQCVYCKGDIDVTKQHKRGCPKLLDLEGPHRMGVSPEAWVSSQAMRDYQDGYDRGMHGAPLKYWATLNCSESYRLGYKIGRDTLEDLIEYAHETREF